MPNLETRKKVETLVLEIETLILQRCEYFTKGTKEAMADLLKDAKLALAHQYEYPFSRSRAFYRAREEEALEFMCNHYTMVPSYRDEGVYANYGLRPALEWLKKQDMSLLSKSELEEKIKYLLSEVGCFIKFNKRFRVRIEREGRIGYYNEEKLEHLYQQLLYLQEELKMFKGSHNKEATHGQKNRLMNIAKNIVGAYDFLRGIRHSQILRTDIEQTGTLFFSQEELEALKEQIHTDLRLKKEYEKVSRIAEENTLEYLEKLKLLMKEEVDYQEANKYFYLWQSTEKTVNFTVPKGSTKARLSFVLPREENEEQGLGHVWIDEVAILNSTGADLVIQNPGFEEGVEVPYHWKQVINAGTPTLKWERSYPFCGREKHSIYIENPTMQDEGQWEYEKAIDIEEVYTYTLMFNAKVDGRFKKGLKVIVTFENDENEFLGDFIYYFNKKAGLMGNPFALSMQGDALLYVVTGNKEYALKVKKQIQYLLNDFCQGIEHWLVTNSRPEGSDAYGAVQGGRILCSLASAYSFVKKENLFSQEEKVLFYRQLEYFLRYLLDMRDRTELTDEAAQRNTGNWQTDMCAGTGMLMMVLEDFPNRKIWLYNANKVLRAQLTLNVNKDGSWPESIRYNQVAIARFSIYAKALQRLTGEDWFSETALGTMYSYALNIQTPTYYFCDNHISTPPFGDHTLTAGEEFAVYGIYLNDIARLDKKLADQMYLTWQSAGFPSTKYWPEAIVMENFFSSASHYQLEDGAVLDLKSCDKYENAGVYVFRKHFAKEDEAYFAIMSSPKRVAHGHLDQGSFIIFKNKTPIVLDSGIEGYFDGSVNWHISSYSHACLQFATIKEKVEREVSQSINLSAGTYSLERGWVDVPYSSKVLEFKTGEEIESISIEIDNPEGKGKHIRTVSFIPKSEVYIIRDEVREFDKAVCFSLPVVATNSRIEGNRVYSEGLFEIDLETIFLGDIPDLKIEQGRCAPMIPSEESGCMMDYIRAVQKGSKGFLTILYPKIKEEARLRVEETEDDYIVHGKEENILISKSTKEVSVLSSEYENVNLN